MPTPQSTRWAAWWGRARNFKLESLFAGNRGTDTPRTIYFNQTLPGSYFDHKRRLKKDHVYCTNQVITSKYNIITFLPRNLLEQFRRIANMYVRQCIPLVSPLNMSSQLLCLHCYPSVFPRIFYHIPWSRRPSPTHRPRHHSHQGWV